MSSDRPTRLTLVLALTVVVGVLATVVYFMSYDGDKLAVSALTTVGLLVVLAYVRVKARIVRRQARSRS